MSAEPTKYITGRKEKTRMPDRCFLTAITALTHKPSMGQREHHSSRRATGFDLFQFAKAKNQVPGPIFRGQNSGKNAFVQSTPPMFTHWCKKPEKCKNARARKIGPGTWFFAFANWNKSNPVAR